jgi:prepilin-type processing-associated H-X9-DG protein
MRKSKGLTRIDVAVALACIALVLAQAAVLNAGGRERSKREACLANLRMLTAAWQMYADDNAGKLVNGAAYSGNPCPTCPADPGNTCAATLPNDPAHLSSFQEQIDHGNELPWLGSYYVLTAPDCGKKCAIDSGALWKYIGDYNIYRCPVGNKNELVTYAIVDGVNGRREGRGTIPTGLWKKTIGQIRKSATQVVFVDEGRITPDSFAVTYGAGGWITPGNWFDGPDARHGDGTTVSLADGHTEYWKWCLETANYARLLESPSPPNWHYFPLGATPQPSDAAYQDLYKMTLGCWGQIGFSIAGHPPQID